MGATRYIVLQTDMVTKEEGHCIIFYTLLFEIQIGQLKGFGIDGYSEYGQMNKW